MSFTDRSQLKATAKFTPATMRNAKTPTKTTNSKSGNQSPINLSRRTSTTPTREKRETSPFTNKFYNRVYEKDERDKTREEGRMAQIKQMAESKKMSENSYRILCKQLEEQLALAIQTLDTNETKTISFEGLGRLLSLFRVFSLIQYNPSLVNQDIFYSQDPRIIAQRDEEMEFHEQLWMLLGGYSRDLPSVSTDFTFTILRLLLDPAQLKSEQQEILFDHYLQKQFVNSPQNRAALLKNPDPNSYPPWSVKQLIAKYRKMTITRIGQIPLGQTKERADLSNSNNNNTSSEFPFHPFINEKSRILDDLNKSKMNVDALLFSKDQDKSTASVRATTPERVLLLQQKNEIRNNKIKELQEEMKECSFQPKTNTSRNASKSPNRSQSEQSLTSIQDRVFERLYSAKNLREDRVDENIRQREIFEEKEAQELKECTFQPALTPYSPSRSKSPNGFDKTVGRVRLGYEKHQEQQRKLEHVETGQGYERRKKSPFRPPEMLNRKETKHKPFIVLDINVAAGRSGRIGICEGDNPVTLAKNFSKAFQLTQDMEETVLEIIQQSIDQHQKNKKQQALQQSLRSTSPINKNTNQFLNKTTANFQSVNNANSTANLRRNTDQEEDSEYSSHHQSYASYS